MKNTAVALMVSLAAGAHVRTADVNAAANAVYELSEVQPAWDGTPADRLAPSTPDYDYTYGDEAALTYSLPWPFVFYGASYRAINVDTNGNIWFTATGSSHSFDIANTGRGPVIAAWNDDLTSHHFGGAFVQHKHDPERVVIEWLAESHREEAYFFMNNFEVVLFPNGDARIDYKSFSTETGRDSGSGISRGDRIGMLSLTSTYGKAFTLAGRSFRVAPARVTRTAGEPGVN